MNNSYYQYANRNEAITTKQIQMTNNITQALQAYKTAIEQGKDSTCLIVGMVFHAGYIAGVRAERAKRHSGDNTKDTLKQSCHRLIDSIDSRPLLGHIKNILDRLAVKG